VDTANAKTAFVSRLIPACSPLAGGVACAIVGYNFTPDITDVRFGDLTVPCQAWERLLGKAATYLVGGFGEGWLGSFNLFDIYLMEGVGCLAEAWLNVPSYQKRPFINLLDIAGRYELKAQLFALFWVLKSAPRKFTV
jgi:hypothetical protein